MEALILAGGLGQRLKSVVAEVPKPMALVQGRPFLEYIIHNLSKFGISRIVLSVGYKHEIIRQYFGDRYGDSELIYSIEKEPLGTGGAISNSINYMRESEILILNGDSFLDLDLSDFIRFQKTTLAQIAIALKPMEQMDRYGQVRMNGNRVLQFEEKRNTADPGLINAGIYLVQKAALDVMPKTTAFSFERDFIQSKLSGVRTDKAILELYGFVSDVFFIDIGIPEDYQRAQSEKFFHEYNKRYFTKD